MGTWWGLAAENLSISLIVHLMLILRECQRLADDQWQLDGCCGTDNSGAELAADEVPGMEANGTPTQETSPTASAESSGSCSSWAAS